MLQEEQDIFSLNIPLHDPLSLCSGPDSVIRTNLFLFSLVRLLRSRAFSSAMTYFTGALYASAAMEMCLAPFGELTGRENVYKTKNQNQDTWLPPGSLTASHDASSYIGSSQCLL